MAAELREMYDKHRMAAFAEVLELHCNAFDKQGFLRSFNTALWREASLNQRVEIISKALHSSISLDYPEAVACLVKIADATPTGYFGVFLPDFVARFGLNHWRESMKALEYFTQFNTSEFAIRQFILLDSERAIKQMIKWSRSYNEHIRRLSSEGCRPRLPWGVQLKSFVANPAAILPILEQLKDDPSLYVRKSVANNLNDISKDHPKLALEIAANWLGKSEYTDWIVQHGIRTLLKKGNKEALKLFNHHRSDHLFVEKLKLKHDKIKLGEYLEFDFELMNRSTNPESCRLEFSIDFLKSNGKHTPKVFQIFKSKIPVGNVRVQRKLMVKDLTTRKHYSGLHQLHILVNGDIKASHKWHLEN